MIIYKITNLINQKIYIGQTIHSLESRWMRHCRNSSTSAISKAIRKHGKSNFKVELIEHCETLEALDLREVYWISHYQSSKKKTGYNKTNGGQCGGLTEEALASMKIKVSLALKGKSKPPKTARQIELQKLAITGKPNVKKQIKIKCSNGEIYNSIKEASQKLEINKSNIGEVVRGVRRSAGGYTFGRI